LENLFLTDEQKMMRNTVRRFIQNEVIPVERKIGALATEVPDEDIVSLQEKGKQMGFWQMWAWPEWGGAGLDILSRTVVMAEASRHRFGLMCPGLNAFGQEIPSVVMKSPSPLTEKMIKPAVDSGAGCFLAVDGSSNFIARREGNNGWVISGRQRFVGNADKAAVGLIWAKMDGSEDTGLFLVENDKRIRSDPVVVMRTIRLFNVSLEDYQAPTDSYLGSGKELVVELLQELQILLAARCLGIAQEALRLGTEYATQRETFGKLLEKREAIQDMVADSVVALESARLLTWATAKKQSLDEASADEVAMAKLNATETAFRIVDQMIQIHGGMGITQEVALERWYRELRLTRIQLVPSEIIRQRLALTNFQKYHTPTSMP
jgi:acyl-CoA dehydrogenase